MKIYAKAFFHLLYKQKKAIESDIGETLDWCELPEKKHSSVVLVREGVDPENRKEWPKYFAWLKDGLERFHQALSWRVKKLDAEDFENQGEADGNETVG